MTPHDYAQLQKGARLRINGHAYTIKEVIVPAQDIEDRMRRFLQVVRDEKSSVIVDFCLIDGQGEKYMLKIRNKPTYFWNTKFGFREEDLIVIKSVEVVL
jgi:hypothetical protein